MADSQRQGPSLLDAWTPQGGHQTLEGQRGTCLCNSCGADSCLVPTQLRWKQTSSHHGSGPASPCLRTSVSLHLAGHAIFGFSVLNLLFLA